MPEAGGEAKSPKTTRRLRTGDSETPPRQVRFEDASTGGASRKPAASIASARAPVADGNQDCQPAGFPALGGPPASVAWYTAADPTRSISSGSGGAAAGPPGLPPGLLPAHVHNIPPQPYCYPQHHHHHHNPPPPYLQNHHSVTFIGHAPQPHPVAAMADYANAGPPPVGVNFQPPVPDTTFGPIPHLYVPRFDPVPQGVQVGGFPSYVRYLPVVAPCPAPRMEPSAATYSVLVPRTFYSGGYPYYQPQAVPVGQPNYVVAPQQQAFASPGQQQQPVMINGQAYIPAGPTMGGGFAQPFVGPTVVQGPVPFAAPGGGGGGPSTVPVMAGNGNNPDVSGLGRTPNEEMLRQIQFAHQNKLFEPQDFKPGDDDPSRFYYVREVDGNWTQRNRYTIDRMSCRWYVTDEGWFYAVRLPD